MTSKMEIEYGQQVWRNQNDELHCLDGPAIIGCDGYQAWFVDGERHRVDGPAIIRPNGYQAWYVDGLRHRIDGPAVFQPNGTQEWWVNGKLHRLDDPAVIYPDGSEEWWISGKNITVQVKQWLNMNNKSYPFDKNTQILFKLTFGV